MFKKNSDVEFVLVGWDVSNYSLPFSHLNTGFLSLDELQDLYSQVDVDLVISSTNLSLLPLELMACKCPVVSNLGPMSSGYWKMALMLHWLMQMLVR